MPCSSGHLAPTLAEETQRTAAHIWAWLYLEGVIEITPDEYHEADRCAKDIYGGETDFAPGVCKVLRMLHEDERKELFFHEDREMGRTIEVWWEAHQIQDKRREEKERKEVLLNKALEKLSKGEREAVVEAAKNGKIS